MKLDNKKKADLLQPVAIPERKWKLIKTDLATYLPESERITAIAVFINRLTKKVRFIPCRKEITTK